MRDPVPPRPAAATTREELIDSIIKMLRESHPRPSRQVQTWRTPLIAESPPDGAVRKSVARAIDYLKEEDAKGWSPRDEAREDARRLKKPIDDMIQALNDISPEGVFAVWSGYRGLTQLLRDFRDLRAAMEAELPSGNTDLIKASCANTSLRLMMMTNQPRIRSAGRLQAIAALLYEAVKGEKDVDMKRSCDDCLKKIRARHEKYGLPGF
jgi:hypothetical protein